MSTTIQNWKSRIFFEPGIGKTEFALIEDGPSIGMNTMDMPA